MLLPNLHYFQVVFTLPDKLSRLVLGNRHALYRLLFRSAWGALKAELKKQNIDPAALLMLHTWDQELGHHPHIHAIVPGGGPSANRDNDPCWVTARDETRPWRDKPSLVDNVALGRAFRDKFVRGLGWLIRNGKLKLDDEWQQLEDLKRLSRWLKSLRQSDWNVFIQGPPQETTKTTQGNSDPNQVLKYLARYMTGGPISDRRIVSDQDGMVSFTARNNQNRKKTRTIKIPGTEFLRRWSLHILPKGFTRSRGYGGFHGSRRSKYLETCRRLLQSSESNLSESLANPLQGSELSAEPPKPKCPRCQIELDCVVQLPRPSWRVVLGTREFEIDWHYEKWMKVMNRPGSLNLDDFGSADAGLATARLSGQSSDRDHSSHTNLSHNQLPRPDD